MASYIYMGEGGGGKLAFKIILNYLILPLLCLFLYSLQHIIPIISTAITAPPMAAMTPLVMAKIKVMYK